MGPKRTRGGADGVGDGSAIRGRAKRVRRGGGAPPATPSVGGGTVCRSTPASGAATGHYHTATKKTTTWLPGPRCLPLDYQCKKLVPLDYQRIEIVPHHYLSVATILLAYQSVPVLPLRYQPHHCICNSVKLLTAQIVPKETT